MIGPTDGTITHKIIRIITPYSEAGLQKSRAPGRRGDQILYGGAQYLWMSSMEFASHHPYAARNFEVAQNFCTPELSHQTCSNVGRNVPKP